MYSEFLETVRLLRNELNGIFSIFLCISTIKRACADNTDYKIDYRTIAHPHCLINSSNFAKFVTTLIKWFYMSNGSI